MTRAGGAKIMAVDTMVLREHCLPFGKMLNGSAPERSMVRCHFSVICVSLLKLHSHYTECCCLCTRISRKCMWINFRYDASKQPTKQTFQVPFRMHFPTGTVFLAIQSKGGSHTTCIYWIGIYGSKIVSNG